MCIEKHSLSVPRHLNDKNLNCVENEKVKMNQSCLWSFDSHRSFFPFVS